MMGIALWKLITSGAIVVVLVSSCALRDMKIEKRGATKVVEASKEKGKANAEKSRKAHEKARTPGAADRLLRDSCRDC